MPKRDLWYADRPNRCEVCGKKGFVQAHHIIKAQTVRRMGGDVWDPRNRLWLGQCCHGAHSNAARRLPLNVLPDSVFEFGTELASAGWAFNRLRAEYSGDDPRLDALLGEEHVSRST